MPRPPSPRSGSMLGLVVCVASFGAACGGEADEPADGVDSAVVEEARETQAAAAPGEAGRGDATGRPNSPGPRGRPGDPPRFRAVGNEPGWVLDVHAERIEILIVDEPCRDSMSGERFPATVILRLDDRTLPGCGGPVP